MRLGIRNTVLMKRTLLIFAGVLVVLAIVFFLWRGGEPKFSAKKTQVAASSSSPAKAGPVDPRSHSKTEPVSQAAPATVQTSQGMPVPQSEPQPAATQASAAKSENVTGTARTTEISGERVSAQVAVAGGSPRTFSPNALGLFPRVPIGLEETVQVAVDYPEGAPGDPVTVQSEDGGSLEENQTVIQSRLDDNRQVRFAFTSTQEGGIYHVTLRKGFDEKHLEFWGGPEPALQSSNR